MCLVVLYSSKPAVVIYRNLLSPITPELSMHEAFRRYEKYALMVTRLQLPDVCKCLADRRYLVFHSSLSLRALAGTRALSGGMVAPFGPTSASAFHLFCLCRSPTLWLLPLLPGDPATTLLAVPMKPRMASENHPKFRIMISSAAACLAASCWAE